MKKLNVDLEELAFAFEGASWEMEYYLDSESGDVIMVGDPDLFGPEMEALRERVESGYGTRYVAVPKPHSREAYGDMGDFILTLEGAGLRGLLEVAIDGPGAFRRFKSVLARYPEVREQWFQFKAARTRRRVLDWLESIGVEPEMGWGGDD